MAWMPPRKVLPTTHTLSADLPRMPAASGVRLALEIPVPSKVKPRMLLPEARSSGRRKPTRSTPAAGAGQPMMVAPDLPTSSTRWVSVAPQNLPRETTIRCPGWAMSIAAWMVG
jgi:hypothetical protein